MVAASTTPRIFVSYSRADQDYAVEQRARIEAERLSLWQDITHMESGNVGGWWDQIKQRLEDRATEHMVLFVSVDSLASGIVADEWRYARRQGVEVHLVKVPGKLGKDEFDAMPASLTAQHFYDVAIDEQFNRLIVALNSPSRQLKVPLMAPVPDEQFVRRPEEADKLIAALLRQSEVAYSRNGRAVGITAALRGAGGYGKTQLARWICHQQRIVDHFYDGILWIELGENPDTTGGLRSRIEFLITQLCRTPTDNDRGFPDATAAAKRLFELLAKGGTKDKGRYLLVIDDVWRKSDLDLFMGEAPSTVRLVTTRIDETLPLGTDKIPVDAMKPTEAVELLAVGLNQLGVGMPVIDANRAALGSIAKRLGEWALLLALANGQLRSEIEAGSPLPGAVVFVGRLYDELGLTAFDPNDETQRSRGAALSIGASLRHLTADEIERFEDLAVFPEDEQIPANTVARLWAQRGNLSDVASQQLLRRLKKYALLMSLDTLSGAVRLHDVIRKFLRDRIGADGVSARVSALVAEYVGCDREDLGQLERDFFLRFFGLSSAAFSRDGRYVVSGSRDGTLRIQDLAFENSRSLNRAFGEVKAVAVSDDGLRVLSGWSDGTLYLWEANGERSRSIAEIEHGVYAVDFFPQEGYAVSGSTFEAHAWELATGRAIPMGTERWPFFAVAVSSNGRLVGSAMARGTIFLYEIVGAQGDARKDSFRSWEAGMRGVGVSAMAFSPDGRRLACGYDNGVVLIWDLGNDVYRMLAGHSHRVRALAFTPDGRNVISGSDDCSLRIWEAARPKEICRLVGDDALIAVRVTIDGRQIVAGDSWGRVHRIDVGCGEAITLSGYDTKKLRLGDAEQDTQLELSKFCDMGGNTITLGPRSPPCEMNSVPPEMRLDETALVGACYIETYRDRRLFMLADGRVYIECLIAVSSHDHARATLDHMAATTEVG